MKLIEAIKVHWITWIWKLTPNCAEMSRLASERLDRSLPLSMRIRMGLHFVICVWCRRYQKQLEFLRHRSRCADGHMAVTARRGMSPEARRRIVLRLSSQLIRHETK